MCHTPLHTEQATALVKTALELGINHFDVAESHAGNRRMKDYVMGNVHHHHHRIIGGQGEIDLGLALRNQKGLRRSDFIISTKVFWGNGKGPNDRGLSRKHVFEGTVACLQRLELDYVDILYAQRPGKLFFVGYGISILHQYVTRETDLDTPMEEIVRAFNWCIDKGMALYWATSEWPPYLIMEAHAVAAKLHLIPPITEVKFG